MLTRSFLLVAVVMIASVAATLSAPRLAEAQTNSCVHCLTVFHPDPDHDYGHTASDLGDDDQSHKRGEPPHPAVHPTVLYPGTCADYHALCPPDPGRVPGDLFGLPGRERRQARGVA